MNKQQIEGMLQDLIMEDGDEIARIETFADAGLLTNDRGLVIHSADGSEFQITIVKSR